MKRLLLRLLTVVTAAGAVTGIAACSLGQTGGGDTAARNAKNSSVTESLKEEQPDMQAPDKQAADGEFEFLPPDNMVQEPMPLPLPPQGRIFAPHVRHPEILQDAPMMGTAKEGTDETTPKGKLPKRKDGRRGDMVTPDDSIMPQVRDTDVKPGGSANGSCPNGCPDSSCPDSSCPDLQEEQPAPQKSAADTSAEDNSTQDEPSTDKPAPGNKRGKNRKNRHKKPDSKEKKGLN